MFHKNHAGCIDKDLPFLCFRTLTFGKRIRALFAGPARSLSTCSGISMALTQDELKKMVGYKVIDFAQVNH